MKFFVYVLKSIKNGFYYKGITADLEARLIQHNKGYTHSNRQLIPFKLVFAQECSSWKEARLLEKYLKSGSGREVVKDIVSGL